MNKRLRGLALILVLILMVATLSACSFLISGNVQELSFDNEEESIYLGEEKQLRYSVKPVNHKETLTFTSSDEAVVTVNNIGRVKGVGVGSADIKVESNVTDTVATVKVNVTYAPVTEITVTSEGETDQLSVRASDVVFTAGAGEFCDPDTVFNWDVKTKAGIAVSFTGGEGVKTFTFKPAVLGVTYVVTASYGEGDDKITSEGIELGWRSAIESVAISATEATAVLGVPTRISAAVNPSTANQDAEITWSYKLAAASTWQLGTDKGTRDWMFTTTSMGDYQIKAEAYNKLVVVSSNVLTISTEYAPVLDVTLSTSAEVCTTKGGLAMSVVWNKRYNAPGTEYDIIWYFNGVRQPAYDGLETIANHKFATAGKVEVEVAVNGVTGNAANITVVEEFDAIKSVNVTASGIADNQRVSTSSATVFTADFGDGVYNSAALVKWYVNGTQRQSGNSKSYTLSYSVDANGAAEYHVQAVVGNVESNVYTIATRGTNSTVSADYFDTYHYYGGYPQNRYITSQEELGNVLGYAHETGKTELDVYVDYQPDTAITGESGKVKRAMNAYDEAGTWPSVSTSAPMGSDVGEISLTLTYTEASVTAPSRSAAYRTTVMSCQNTVSKPNVSASGRKDTDALPVDSFPSWNENVATTNLLYKVIDWGYKPVFSNTSSAAYEVYAEAQRILRTIIDDTMSDYEKTLAIYDWICYYVVYDYSLAGMSADLNEMMKYSGYYLEGAILDRKAVCDGKSKAFTLLCAMEGIDSVRITGEAASQAGGTPGNHAWNKVLIDANGDDVLEWYFVDSTWGDTGTNASCGEPGHSRNEVLLHKYFLLSDAETAATHSEAAGRDYPDAVNDFDYYTYTAIGGQTLYVANTSQLRTLVTASSSTHSYLEIKIASTYETSDNIFTNELLGVSHGYNRSYRLGDIYILYK